MIKKIVLLVLAAVVLIFSAEIPIYIPDKLVHIVIEAENGLNPVPMVEVDSSGHTIMRPKYTPAQWAKRCIIKNIKRDVEKWQHRTRAKAVRDSIKTILNSLDSTN